MNHYWGCPLIYRQLSYPFRPLGDIPIVIKKLRSIKLTFVIILDGCSIYVDIMIGEKFQFRLPFLLSFFGQFVNPVGGKRMGWRKMSF